MTILGPFEVISPGDEAASTKVRLARPGHVSVSLMATVDKAKTQSNLAEMIRVDAERARDRALRNVDLVRSSTTLAALAQTHASLGDVEAAVTAAREAIDLSANISEDGNATWLDPSSARIAGEVLLRFDDAAYAYEALKRVPIPASLSVTFASVAAVLGEFAEAEKALAPYDNWAVAAFRGYLHACAGEFRKAVPLLRRALSEEPNDADSLLNLAISFWNLDSRQKATRIALRATRSAPGRKDFSLLYLQMLLAEEDIDRLTGEIATLRARKVAPDARFLEIQARARILAKDWDKAISLLTSASILAKREGDQLAEGNIRSNLIRIKLGRGSLSRAQAREQLAPLVSQFPGNDAVVVAYAEVAERRHEAALLRKGLSQVENITTKIRLAYLRFQIAVLEGDNDAAGAAAAEWFGLEPENPMAASAALLAIGIGQERWDEATAIAEYALEHFSDHRATINHAAFVLAMNGRAKEAIKTLAPRIDDDFVMTATLGLAHLADGNIDQGMRLYREAAEMADKIDPQWRSLMTAYQALVVRQLGLDKALPEKIIRSLPLVPISLPEDWRDYPDFLRLHAICVKNGYDWPLSL